MIKILLFDLGGVIMNWTGPQEFQKFLGDQITVDEARLLLSKSAAIKDLDTGRVSALSFAEMFLQEFDLPFTAPEFIKVFASWAGRPYDGVFEVLAFLRKEYQLSCLSNTNEIHWGYLMDEAGLRQKFDTHFASHILKLAKPDPAAFNAVLSALKTKPEEILFFDDLEANISIAEELGFVTCKVNPETGVTPHLQSLSLLDKGWGQT